jgi:hypothetical protein
VATSALACAGVSTVAFADTFLEDVRRYREDNSVVAQGYDIETSEVCRISEV